MHRVNGYADSKKNGHKQLVGDILDFQPTNGIPNRFMYINKAVYTATEVACGWAGAVTQKPPVNAKKS